LSYAPVFVGPPRAALCIRCPPDRQAGMGWLTGLEPATPGVTVS